MRTCLFSALLFDRRRAISRNRNNLVYRFGTVPDVLVGSGRVHLGIMDPVCFSFAPGAGDLGSVTAGIRAGSNEIWHQGQNGLADHR